jgi:hypothetical protein
LGKGRNFFRSALACDLAACGAGSRSEFDQVVGTTKSFLVVFDHNQGVAEIAKLKKEVEEAGVFRWVKADTGFIQDIEDTC